VRWLGVDEAELGSYLAQRVPLQGLCEAGVDSRDLHRLDRWAAAAAGAAGAAAGAEAATVAAASGAPQQRQGPRHSFIHFMLAAESLLPSSSLTF